MANQSNIEHKSLNLQLFFQDLYFFLKFLKFVYSMLFKIVFVHEKLIYKWRIYNMKYIKELDQSNFSAYMYMKGIGFVA